MTIVLLFLERGETMPEIDRLSLEIKDKASDSSKGIDNLILKLNKLDKAMSTSVPRITKLSDTFTKLRTATNGLQNINFNNLNNSMNQLSRSFNKIETATKNFNVTSQSIKNMSNALNSLMRSINKSSGQIGFIDLTTLSSQSGELSKLAEMNKSLAALKDSAKSINSLVNSFKKLNALDFSATRDSLKNLSQTLQSIKDITSSFGETVKDIKSLASALNSLANATNKLSKANSNNNAFNFNISSKSTSLGALSSAGAASALFSAGQFTAVLIAIQKVVDVISSAITKTNDYIEAMNLFEVVMGNNAKTAWEFTQALSEIGLNQTQIMKYQSSFYDIGKSLGMTSQNAYTLSEQFTKLAYDYSSLYNLDVEESFTKLQAAVVGEVEPIRRLGKDISEARLQQVAWNLGIQSSVRNMSQADKAMLRFIAVMEQSQPAMNDLERTINQPANSLRVLQAQFESLAREFGNLFVPALTATLPVLIAFTRILREIVAEIASFFGISMPEIDFSNLNNDLGVSDAYSDSLADNLGTAASNAAKLKNYMLGVDELNVLDSSTTTGGGTGTPNAGVGSVLGGLDLSDFGYDILLKDVDSKVDELTEKFRGLKDVIKIGLGGALFGILGWFAILPLTAIKTLEVLKSDWGKWWKLLKEDPSKFFRELIPTVAKKLGEMAISALGKLKDLSLNVSSWIGDTLFSIGDWLTRWSLGDLLDALGDVFFNVLNFLKEKAPEILSWHTELNNNLSKGLIFFGLGVITWIGNSIIDILAALGKVALSIINWVAGLGKSVLTALNQQVGTKWNSFWNGLSTWFSGIISGIGNFMGGISKGMSTGYTNIKNIWVMFWNGLQTFFPGITSGISNFMKGIYNTIINIFNNIKYSWNSFWNGLPTWFTGPISGIGDLMYGIYNKVTGWFRTIGNEWNKFWKDPLGYVGGAVSGIWNSIFGSTTMSVGLNYQPAPFMAPEVTAFARGGFVPANAQFVPPNTSLWTAGEAGREVVGNFNGKTTVMPLEDTGFVQAIYNAVYQAVKDVKDTGSPVQITVQPQVRIGNRDIKQAQETYDFDSGGSLIRKR